MKRLLVLGALAVAGTLAFVAFNAFAGASGRTIHVIEHATTDAVTNSGSGGKADNVGDVLTWHNQLFDKSDSTKVGRDQGMCVRTIVGVAYECWWTNFLAGGQITVEGPFYNHNSRVAITGGTGAYAKATGWTELNYHNKAGTKFDFVFHLGE
jgi:allene oxide cyclase